MQGERCWRILAGCCRLVVGGCCCILHGRVQHAALNAASASARRGRSGLIYERQAYSSCIASNRAIRSPPGAIRHIDAIVALHDHAGWLVHPSVRRCTQTSTPGYPDTHEPVSVPTKQEPLTTTGEGLSRQVPHRQGSQRGHTPKLLKAGASKGRSGQREDMQPDILTARRSKSTIESPARAP